VLKVERDRRATRFHRQGNGQLVLRVQAPLLIFIPSLNPIFVAIGVSGFITDGTLSTGRRFVGNAKVDACQAR
jgi:hypothetical protein